MIKLNYNSISKKIIILITSYFLILITTCLSYEKNIINKREPSKDNDIIQRIISFVKDNLTIIIAGAAVIFVLVIIYIYARIKYKKGRNTIVFTLALIVTNLGLDITFILKNILTDDGRFLLIPSLVALCLPFGFNLALAFYIISQQSVSSNNEEFARWLRKYRRFAGAMTVLSMVHIEVLRLLNSKFLGLEIFKARFDRGAVKKIFMGGLFNLIIEDIPQLVIVALYQQKTQSREVVPILTIISGVIMLLNDLISRIYELITVPKPRKSDVNPSSEEEDKEFSGNLDNTSNPSLVNPNFYSNHSNNSSHHDLNVNYPITNYPLQPITNYPLQPITNYPLQPTTNYPLQPITNYPLSLTTQPIVPNNQRIEISPEGQPYTTGYVYVPN
nr:5157_t:CDS:2 [Entrophospora candida]